MLKKILSITGHPGLFEIKGQGKNMILVEDITTHKRFPATGRDKIVALGDIAMYTDEGDTPLGDILDRVYSHFEGKEIDYKKLQKEGKLAETFGAIVPDFDRDRVNLLIGAGFTTFAAKEEEKGEEKEEEKAE